MTAAESNLHRLHRLRRRLDDIRSEVDTLRPPPSWPRVRAAWHDVKAFLRCWLRGHPREARRGAACPRCGSWLAVSREETLRQFAPALAALHHAEMVEARRAISLCPAGGYHAYGEGPCFSTASAAILYRDRLDAAGVRWLPRDERSPAPIPVAPQDRPDPQEAWNPVPDWLVLRGRVPRADPAH